LTPPEARKVASFSVVAAEQALVDRDEQWLSWSLRVHDLEQFRDERRSLYDNWSGTDIVQHDPGF
jgi:hypothetical protein